jgi:hypothetical protein
VHARYAFSPAHADALQAVKGAGPDVTLTLYELDVAGGAVKGAGPPPYAFVVVAEERERSRWVGAPSKFCHAATAELEAAGGPAQSSKGAGAEGEAALWLVLRNCHDLAARRTPKIPTRDELQTLMHAVLGARRGGGLVVKESRGSRAFLDIP